MVPGLKSSHLGLTQDGGFHPLPLDEGEAVPRGLLGRGW